MKLVFLSVYSLLIASFIILPKLCLAIDGDNLQDICPTNTSFQNIFFNGLPCKSPGNVTASDFTSSSLNDKGSFSEVFRSSTKIVTALEFPGLNTLALSVARTDLEVDGIVTPHAHPRASEMIFVSTGVVAAGFIDTKNSVFQKTLREGDVFVFPRGLLHYCVNNGFEDATVFSVLNSQNPGLVSILGPRFASVDEDDDLGSIKRLKQRLLSLSKLEAERLDNVALF